LITFQFQFSALSDVTLNDKSCFVMHWCTTEFPSHCIIQSSDSAVILITCSFPFHICIIEFRLFFVDTICP